MARIAQISISLGLLGIVITLVGLFPGMVAIPPTPGFGITQILIVTFGFSVLMLAALLYVKFSFYLHQEHTLVQQVGIRLTYTGIAFAALVALADVLGFGSNLREEGADILTGPIQLTGILTCFGVAALGVVIYAVAGTPKLTDEATRR